ncbi:MAG TPA: hypothetical protein PKC42_02470 [Candidatus Nanoperiomorbaceae bacterium]|nr:hypothetical protein [Candidatus Nanoperiomorbaceae bacterium]HMQ96943.1 hypothetical protein [Candidatus Nanoperiomorbaceae bacterium]
MNPQPTDQEDTYAVSVGALSASSRASKLTQTTLYLIIGFVIVAIGSAALVVPKIIANNDQSKEVDALQAQIDEQSRKLHDSSTDQ